MLKLLFQRPRAEWALILQQNRALLDSGFFAAVEQRLLRDEQEVCWEDAGRFATVGDLAGQVMGRPPRYCAGLRALLERRGLAELDFGLDSDLAEAGKASPWRALETSLSRWPEQCAKSLRRAEVEWARGNRDVAVRYFRDASVQDPTSVAAHLRLGMCYGEQGDTGKAILELERAVTLAPHNTEAWMQLGLNQELRFDKSASIIDWDQAERAYRNAAAGTELKRLSAKHNSCRADLLTLGVAGDWTFWIPSRRDTYGIGSYVGNWNDDDEDQFVDLEPIQASGALVWRGTRSGSLVWVRSRQPDTKLLRDGRLVLELGCAETRAWGKPAAVYVHRKRKCRLAIYCAPAGDIGLQVQGGKVSELILMEKGRLLREMRELKDWRRS